MTRRQFSGLCGGAILIGDRATGQPLKLSGDFDFSFSEGHLKLAVKDALIDGLTVPTLSWQWIGLALAEGVFSAFGGALIGALIDAVRGGSGVSLAELLQQQLEAFAAIVQEELAENDLRNFVADIDTYGQLFGEFGIAPNRTLLENLLFQSAITLGRLKSLDYLGYHTYMIGTGLRLAMIQEAIKRGVSKLAIFRGQVAEAVDYHKHVVSIIDKLTSPENLIEGQRNITLFPPAVSGLPIGRYSVVIINKVILGQQVRGSLLLYNDRPLPLQTVEGYFRKNLNLRVSIVYPADWQTTRAQLKKDTTDWGGKMIERWTAYKG